MSKDEKKNSAFKDEAHACFGKETASPDKVIAWQLIQTFTRFRRSNFQRQTTNGYTHSDMMMLMMIKRNSSPDSPGMKVSEIGHQLRVKSPTVTQQIKPLEADGLVERTPDPGDRRVARISLTEKGEQLTKQFEHSILESVSGLVRHLGEEDSKQFVDLLSRSITYFKNKQEQQS